VVRRLEQENAPQCSGISSAATQRDSEYDRFKMAVEFLVFQRPIGYLVSIWYLWPCGSWTLSLQVMQQERDERSWWKCNARVNY